MKNAVDISGRPVVVGMLTYRRPKDLAEAIPVITRHASAAGATLLVIDNDPAGSAREVVGQFADSGVRYVNETRPGIAAARNRAIAEAGDDALLIFIDDDERPQDNWLDLLLTTYTECGSAAVVGAVVSEFDETPDEWIVAGQFFNRRRLPTGTEVEVAATNNLLLDLSQINAFGLRFDERFGQSGGSDTLFTRQLTKLGGKMIWCDAAVVVDKVPADRLTRDWVLRRAFRSGNSWTRTSVELQPKGFARVRARGTMAAIGAMRIAGGSAALLVGVFTRSLGRRVRGIRTFARGAGMLAGAFGYVYQEYSRAKRRAKAPQPPASSTAPRS